MPQSVPWDESESKPALFIINASGEIKKLKILLKISFLVKDSASSTILVM